MLSREENNLLTRTGPSTPMGQLMRRYWVPVLFSGQLPEPDCPPLRITLLHENLVAFRDTNGRVGVLAQHCPHRGASLFFGRNEECGLRCVYHGWKFDVDGNCVDMPNEPHESNFKQKINTTAYPCEERGGVIWAYMGRPELKPGLPELEWTRVHDSHRFATRHTQECNWLQALEGGFDTSHVPILHRGYVNAPPGMTLAPTLEIVPTDAGFMLGTGRTIGNGESHWGINQWLMPWYKLITRTGDVPIGTHAWVPIDDERCMVWSIEYLPERPFSKDDLARSMSFEHSIHLENEPGSDRPVRRPDNDYMIDREWQRNGDTQTGIKGLGTQDVAMQESMGPIYDRTTEHLGMADAAIIGLRRELLRVLKEGGDPPGLDPATHHVRSGSLMLPAGTPFTAGAAREFLQPELPVLVGVG